MKTLFSFRNFITSLILLSLLGGCSEEQTNLLTQRSTGNIEYLRLLCEQADNPIGVPTDRPHFSWIVASKERGSKQTAYRIEVASSEKLLKEDKPDLWDSGKRDADKSLHIAYEGGKLKSASKYFWRLTTWDDKNNEAIAIIQRFSTALLDPKEWKADWIALEDEPEILPAKGFLTSRADEQMLTDSIRHEGRSMLLRKEIALKRRITGATLFASGLGHYEFFINGQRVGDKVLAPAKTPYHKQVLYNTYDVKEHLKSGLNTLAFHVGNGWYNPYKQWWNEYRMQWFGHKKAIAQLIVNYEDNKQEVYITDESWKGSYGPLLVNCIYDGEIYDANLDQKGWNDTGFDDNHWQQAKTTHIRSARMEAEFMPAVRVIETTKPVKESTPKANMKVYDFGQNVTGFPRLVMKAPKGTKIEINSSESLNEDGTIDRTINEGAATRVEYIFKGEDEEHYEPCFTYFGFQYLEITGETLPEIISIERCVVHTDAPIISQFNSDSEIMNRLHKATLWSQRSNIMGYPMDCPQRDERLGWLGDAQVSAEQTYFNFDVQRFFRNWYEGIRLNQDPSGDISIISPRPYIKDHNPEWSSTYLTMLWTHYLYYGDLSLLMHHYTAMASYTNYLLSITTEGVTPSGWIGDWGSLVSGWKEGQPLFTSTAYLYYNLSIMQKASGLLGKTKEQERYRVEQQKLKAQFNARWFNASTGNYEDGTANNGSQMANALPLFLGIAPEEESERIMGNIVNDIKEKNNTHLTTGVLGTKYLFEVLGNHGRQSEGWALINQKSYPGWWAMMEKYNTVCEFWTMKQSKNHVMMGSVCAWFYKQLAGIHLDESNPAYGNIIIKPYIPEDLNHISFSTESCRGTVSSAWKKEGERLIMEITVPYNCSATAYIPCPEGNDVAETSPNSTDNTARRLGYSEGYALFNIGSGNYRFESYKK